MEYYYKDRYDKLPVLVCIMQYKVYSIQIDDLNLESLLLLRHLKPLSSFLLGLELHLHLVGLRLRLRIKTFSKT